MSTVSAGHSPGGGGTAEGTVREMKPFAQGHVPVRWTVIPWQLPGMSYLQVLSLSISRDIGKCEIQLYTLQGMTSHQELVNIQDSG